jgi:transposase-like protein
MVNNGPSASSIKSAWWRTVLPKTRKSSSCPVCGSDSTHLIGKSWPGSDAMPAGFPGEWDRFLCEDCWHRWDVERTSFRRTGNLESGHRRLRRRLCAVLAFGRPHHARFGTTAWSGILEKRRKLPGRTPEAAARTTSRYPWHENCRKKGCGEHTTARKGLFCKMGASSSDWELSPTN